MPSRWNARKAARAGTETLLDVLHPLLVLGKGARCLAGRGMAWWTRTPRERRGPTLFAVGACGVLLWLLPYGPPLAVLGTLGVTAWYGRQHTAGRLALRTGPTEVERARLQALYEALVPCFALDGDPRPEPLYAYDGRWERAFEEFGFRDGRISELLLRYPASFRDGELAERLRVEQLLAAKTGRGREYRFCWDEECNLLEMTALEPLPTGIHAQPFLTGPGETLLGFTDGCEVHRTVPVRFTGEAASRDVPPVMWRTGSRSTEHHLLAVGTPGSGTSSLLRSLALQALCHGEVLIVDGDGGGEFASFAARCGVLGVESTLPGALAALEWAARETERRLLEASRARQRGEGLPDDVRRPLWVLVDRPAALSCLARAEGCADPQELLRFPLRHGRAAGVTVAVAEQFDGAGELAEAVLAHTRARVVLGAVPPEQAGAVLGEAPQTGPAPGVPPGRGFARLGDGPVLRLQVPATPDPLDETAGEAERSAVRELLPEPVRAPAHAPAPTPSPGTADVPVPAPPAGQAT
ncbi:hypothetical protein ITI46_04470 [Streptomyces oryzae]|uniref:FtsK domain-containing protein n=2 Tax=Streptomyces oryzae TaxID=1434886 RepID=A0ABS3X6I4_9ACTN|nr:hypothetical protein [Streptomyces oryzae]MBO8190953.1 hypothetical protein [Streptomyces oryzae]